MAPIRLALGYRRAQQYVITVFSPGLWLVGVVPSRKMWQAIDLRRGARCRNVLRVCVVRGWFEITGHSENSFSSATILEPNFDWEMAGVRMGRGWNICIPRKTSMR